MKNLNIILLFLFTLGASAQQKVYCDLAEEATKEITTYSIENNIEIDEINKYIIYAAELKRDGDERDVDEILDSFRKKGLIDYKKRKALGLLMTYLEYRLKCEGKFPN